GAALDGLVDVVRGHRGLLRRGDRRAQARVGVDAAAPDLGGHRDLLDQLREEPAALCVRGALLVLDRAPFIVTGHWLTSSAPAIWGRGFLGGGGAGARGRRGGRFGGTDETAGGARAAPRRVGRRERHVEVVVREGAPAREDDRVRLRPRVRPREGRGLALGE